MLVLKYFPLIDAQDEDEELLIKTIALLASHLCDPAATLKQFSRSLPQDLRKLLEKNGGHSVRVTLGELHDLLFASYEAFTKNEDQILLHFLSSSKPKNNQGKLLDYKELQSRIPTKTTRQIFWRLRALRKSSASKPIVSLSCKQRQPFIRGLFHQH